MCDAGICPRTRIDNPARFRYDTPMDMEFLNRLDEYLAARDYRLVSAVLAYQDGAPVFERYLGGATALTRGPVKSVWKSILSLVLGVCLGRGLIGGLDEPVGRYLAPFAEGKHPLHRDITLRHLLAQRSGIRWRGGIRYRCPPLEEMHRAGDDWISYIAALDMDFAPGSRFIYKEWDAILLSAVLGRACGGTAWEVCEQYLYKPLEITSKQWTTSPRGVCYPCRGEDDSANLTPRDMAKLGQLMLDCGRWRGARLIPAQYAAEAVRPPTPEARYGLLWWLSPQGAFHARGFGGQEISVFPNERLVTVIQAVVTPENCDYSDIAMGIRG